MLFEDITPEELKERFSLKKFKHAKDKLTWEQKELLKKNGTRMKAFMDRRLIPFGNHKAKHFIEMCDGLVEPYDEYERAWKTYLLMLEEEKRLKELHRAELAQENEQQLPSLYLSGDSYVSEEVSPNIPDEEISPNHYPRTKRCPRCRGEGLDCPKCDGKGEIVIV